MLYLSAFPISVNNSYADKTTSCEGKLQRATKSSLWCHYSYITAAQHHDASNHRNSTAGSTVYFQSYIKENTKAPSHWPFVVGTYGWSMDFLYKGLVTRILFLCHDIIMFLHRMTIPKTLFSPRNGKVSHRVLSHNINLCFLLSDAMENVRL